MLLSNQKICQTKIKEFLDDINKNIMIIEGEKNIGKLQVIYNTLENPNVMYFKNKHVNSREYFPFYNVINEKKNIFTTLATYPEELAKDFKPAPNLLSNFLKAVKQQKINDTLSGEEQNILSHIQRIIKRKKDYIFIIENLYEWDKESIHLLKILYCLLKKTKDNKYKWVFTSNDNNETIMIKHAFNQENRISISYYKMKSLSFEDFKLCINFFDDKGLYSSKECLSLYKIIGSDIEAIKWVCNSKLLSEGYDESTNKSELIKLMIEQKLRELGANGDLIIHIMEYIGVLNKIVSIDELSYFFNKMEGQIRDIVEEAYKNYLLIYEDDKNNYVDFCLNIVKKIYLEINFCDKIFYKKIADCLQILYPLQYEKRGDILVNAGEKREAAICYSLEVILQLRNDQKTTFNINQKLELFASDDQKTFIIYYKKGLTFLIENKYNDAIKILASMSNIPDVELKAERDIILSLCFTKILRERQKALDILERYDSCFKVNNEIDIWERILDRKLFANVHLGNLNEARKLEEALSISYGNRVKYDKSIYEKWIHLDIRSNALYSAEVSLQKNKNAHHKFIENNIKRILLFYFILTNESAANIINGEFDTAYSLCIDAIKLIQTEDVINFPRTEIIYSNYVLSGFLCKKLSIEKCLEYYKQIMDNIPMGAEKIFFTSNYSIFLSIAKQNEKAYELLYNEAILQSVEQLDKESLYSFRVCYNLAIFSYLSKNTDKCYEYINRLKNISLGQIDQEFIKRKIKCAIDLIENNKEIEKNDWLHIYNNTTTTSYEKPWRYYGLGYAFTALSNWNDI